MAVTDRYIDLYYDYLESFGFKVGDPNALPYDYFFELMVESDKDLN